jgi:hypothetical protein
MRKKLAATAPAGASSAALSFSGWLYLNLYQALRALFLLLFAGR